jgi:hypothetical protein
MIIDERKNYMLYAGIVLLIFLILLSEIQVSDSLFYIFDFMLIKLLSERKKLANFHCVC